jgi:gluconate 2-dehydrogenase gamma chain
MKQADAIKRREFLTIPAVALGGTLLYTLAGEPFRLSAQTANAQETVRVPLRFFTEQEARVVAAACERIFPGDASGPGATEAGTAIYIDRQLAGPYGRDQYRYTKGPWFETYPEHGYQGKENPRDTYRQGLQQLGADFPELPIDEQNKKLISLEKTHFFALLRSHTVEGMFCDPMHGGNAGMIGWQLIGYPGPRMSYRDEIDSHYGEAFKMKPASLEQAAGRPGNPWEDEKDE